MIEGLDIKPGEVNYIQVRHDAWCRAQHTQRASDCICNAVAAVVSKGEFFDGVTRMNRAQRRAAERAARRAKR